MKNADILLCAVIIILIILWRDSVYAYSDTETHYDPHPTYPKIHMGYSNAPVHKQEERRDAVPVMQRRSTPPYPLNVVAENETSSAPIQTTSVVQRVHFEDVEMVEISDDFGFADNIGGETSSNIDMVWANAITPTENDDKMTAMLKNTLRDNITPHEDNIVEDMPQAVKDAFVAPSASAIRESISRSSYLYPEVECTKTNGAGRNSMDSIFRDRNPTSQISANVDTAQWGVTDAYMHQKSLT